MTNQEEFKLDTEQLHGKINAYLRKYHFVKGTRTESSVGEQFKAQLRSFLEIVRTDEENSQQCQIDCYT